LLIGINKTTKGRTSLRPIDIATISYLILMGTLILLFHPNLRHWGWDVCIHYLSSLLIYLFVRRSKRFNSPILIFLRNWYPVLLLTPMFEELGRITTILFPYWVEVPLMRWDHLLFGVHPTVWFGQIAHPWLTEYMEFSYFMYFLLIPIGGFPLYFRGKKEEFNKFLFNVLLAYYISFIGFLFFPARGPWETMVDLHSAPLQGGFFLSLVRKIQSVGSIHGGCLPSSHVAAAFAILFSAKRYEKTVFWILLPIVLSLAVAVVYTRYHYAVDSLAGVAVGIICAFIGPRISRWFGGVKIEGKRSSPLAPHS